MLANFTMDEGEYLRVEVGDGSTPSDPPWDDLSGCSVVMSLRSWTDGTRTQALGSLDAPGADGKIHACGAVVPVSVKGGRYDGEILVDRNGEPGYPQVFSFGLSVRSRTAAL